MTPCRTAAAVAVALGLVAVPATANAGGGHDDAVTGIAVDRTGVVHVSDLLEGFPAGGPGPGFDPSTVGQVVRIDRHGDRTYSQVTMPCGLVLEDGDLYASARSVGSFVMMPSAGQVVRVGEDSFRPPPAP
jgi:hypothetical protein